MEVKQPRGLPVRPQAPAMIHPSSFIFPIFAVNTMALISDSSYRWNFFFFGDISGTHYSRFIWEIQSEVEHWVVVNVLLNTLQSSSQLRWPLGRSQVRTWRRGHAGATSGMWVYLVRIVWHLYLLPLVLNEVAETVMAALGSSLTSITLLFNWKQSLRGKERPLAGR